MPRASFPLGQVRGVLYALLTVVTGSALSVGALALFPLVKWRDPSLFAYHWATMFCSRVIARLFGLTPIVRGRQHIVQGRAAIIVSNHQSDLDSNLISFAAHDVNFKSVYKKELLYLPGIGSTMYMCGYIVVDRGNKDSARRMYEACVDYIRRGVWVLFFPEGTRKLDVSTPFARAQAALPGAGGCVTMGEFKAGAFKLALETGAPLQPISVSGSRSLMSAFGTIPSMNFPDVGSPVVTIHEAVYPREGDTVDSLMARAREAISKGLRSLDGLPVPTAPGGGPAAARDAPASGARAR